jgi:hypothetical protein
MSRKIRAKARSPRHHRADSLISALACGTPSACPKDEYHLSFPWDTLFFAEPVAHSVSHARLDLFCSWDTPPFRDHLRAIIYSRGHLISQTLSERVGSAVTTSWTVYVLSSLAPFFRCNPVAASSPFFLWRPVFSRPVCLAVASGPPSRQWPCAHARRRQKPSCASASPACLRSPSTSLRQNLRQLQRFHRTCEYSLTPSIRQARRQCRHDCQMRS